jgi:uncharacterized delta-60 repeat protein
MLGRSILVAIAAMLVATGVAGSAPGSLDPAFSQDGWVLSRDFPAVQEYEARKAEDIVLQPDGKIVATGELADISPATAYLFAALRYTANGDLDRSFGQGGVTTTDVGTFGMAHSVALQRDGKIVLAGEDGDHWPPPIVLARYLPNGALDQSFGDAGIVRIARRWWVARGFDLAIQADGKILTGALFFGDPNGRHFALFAVVRFLPSGRLDRTFGRKGIANVGRGSRNWAPSALTLQRDGRIVVVGDGTAANGSSEFAIARLTRNGRLDRTFSGDGLQTVGLSSRQDHASAVALDRGGRIVIAGSSTHGTTPYKEARFSRIAVTRLLPNGRLDRRFGFRRTRPHDRGSGAAAVAVQPDGRVVVVGYEDTDRFGTSTSWVAARFLPNGGLDRGFGRGGFVIVDFRQTDDSALATALQPDGKIVVGGTVGVSQGIARFLAR